MRQVTESVKTFALRTQVIHTLRTTFKPVSTAKTQHLVFMAAEQHNILCDSALTLLAGVVIFDATSASGIQPHIYGLDPPASITPQHADLAPKALPSKGFASVLVVIAALLDSHHRGMTHRGHSIQLHAQFKGRVPCRLRRPTPPQKPHRRRRSAAPQPRSLRPRPAL